MAETTAPEAPLVGALLRIPWETVRERMLSGLHARGYTDLVAAHLNVLQYPGPENQRPLDLARRIRMTKQALNYLLGQMEELGYLVRQDDDEDRRSRRIHLTPRGHAVIRAIRDIVREVEAEWAQQLGVREFARLKDLLTKLQSIAAQGTAQPDRADRGDGHRDTRGTVGAPCRWLRAMRAGSVSSERQGEGPRSSGL